MTALTFRVIAKARLSDRWETYVFTDAEYAADFVAEQPWVLPTASGALVRQVEIDDPAGLLSA